MATQQADDEIAIRQRIDQMIEAIQRRDLEAVKASYAPDIVSFDVEPPLQVVGAEAKSKNWVDAFAALQGPLRYEVRNLAITVDREIAFTHSTNRLSGRLKNGKQGGFWIRATLCLRKIDGQWLIAHDHASVPLDVGSGRALLDLEP